MKGPGQIQDQLGVLVTLDLLVSRQQEVVKGVFAGADLAAFQQPPAGGGEEHSHVDRKRVPPANFGRPGHVAVEADLFGIDQRGQPDRHPGRQIADRLRSSVFDADRSGIVGVVRLALESHRLIWGDGGLVVLHSHDPRLDFTQKLLVAAAGRGFGSHP